MVAVAVVAVVAWHILDEDKDRVVDRDDTDIADSAKHVQQVVDSAKHAKHAKHAKRKDKTAVMAWVGVVVWVAANRQAF